MSDDANALAAPKHASTGLYVRASAGYRLRDKKVERLARKVRDALPWLEPADFPAVRTWAEMEYLAGQVYAALRAGSVINVKGEARRLLHDYRQMRIAQASIAASLGMTPASRMALKATGTRTAFDLPLEMLKNVAEIGESRAVDRALRAQELKTDG
jgi:hypothetical protein